MADGATIDSSDFARLAADLGKVPPETGEYAAKALEVSARRVRDDWRQNATGLAHAPAFPYSITYDVGSTSGALRGLLGGAGAQDLMAEIGPEKGRAQGALGNLIEFGSVNNPPMGLGHGALQLNEPDFEQGIDRAIADGLRAAGL